ncbi:hypothetical protein HYFRA_00009620 [Hymenoscyphus fraxineus]|uniref:Uncharacterized protein n=1 Tax=Hymenoscyphus fraxineus TaxID=746836 RepID=A0A9N9KSW6_9HELO|nr:hypothetical protein HYFRA_00009620 [Hymenoscyphus fraxineus]
MPTQMPEKLVRLLVNYVAAAEAEKQTLPYTEEQETISMMLSVIMFNKHYLPLVRSSRGYYQSIIPEKDLPESVINFIKEIKEVPQAEIDTWDFEQRKSMYHFKGFLQEEGFDLGIDLKSPEWLSLWIE